MACTPHAGFSPAWTTPAFAGIGSAERHHPLKADPPDDGFSPSPLFRNAKRVSDRTRGLIQTGGVGTPHELDIDPVSLRRTGRAILMASSATGSAQCRMVSPAPFRSFGNEVLRVSCTHIHNASKVLLFRRMSRDPVSQERISARSPNYLKVFAGRQWPQTNGKIRQDGVDSSLVRWLMGQR